MEKISIENTLSRVDKIINERENDSKSLKDILELYEEGMALIGQSKKVLEEAQLKVKQFQNDEVVEFEEKK